MKFPVTTFPNEETSYICPSWEEMNTLAFDLAEQIVADGVTFDRIVTLAKGGWPMTRSLVDFLNIDEVASVGIKFYAGINKRMSRPEVYQNLPIAVKGERVLLFDDVADSGESLEFTKEFLQERGIEDVKCATLFYKPHSSLKPEYYAAETSSWIIFPYEILECMEQLELSWKSKGISQDEIQRRFKELKINDGYINHYEKLYSL